MSAADVDLADGTTDSSDGADLWTHFSMPTGQVRHCLNWTDAGAAGNPAVNAGNPSAGCGMGEIVWT